MKYIRTLALLGLLIVSTYSYAAKVDTLSIAGSSMNKSYKAAVVLPDSYFKSKSVYPVLYLLHGAYGHFDNWLRKTPNPLLLHQLVDQYNLIIVLPEGENFSFYLNGLSPNVSQFETYIAKDVVTKIDEKYRTIKQKEGRAISGLSMGGHGALYLSTKHPEVFGAAGSMSGAVDMGSMLDRENSNQVIKNIESVFANKSADRKLYLQHAIINLVDEMKQNNMPLYIDCGVDDFLIEANRELHRRLVYRKVAHDYTERPGAHTWQYWENSLPYHVKFFSLFFQSYGSNK